MKSKAITELEDAIIDGLAASHPHFPRAYIPRQKRSDKTANGLTQCIIEYIQMHGGQAERINVMGRPIETAGGLKWAKSNMTVGTADISAIVAGRAVKIEVKIGADRQSDDQRRYQSDVERAGGLYYIAKTFDNFVEWYNLKFCSDGKEI